MTKSILKKVRRMCIPPVTLVYRKERSMSNRRRTNERANERTNDTRLFGTLHLERYSTAPPQQLDHEQLCNQKQQKQQHVSISGAGHCSCAHVLRVVVVGRYVDGCFWFPGVFQCVDLLLSTHTRDNEAPLPPPVHTGCVRTCVHAYERAMLVSGRSLTFTTTTGTTPCDR